MAALTRQQLEKYFDNHTVLRACESVLERVYPEGSSGVPTPAEADSQRLLMTRFRAALRSDAVE